jgi:CRP/FNR family cyclic AMP-dependent transcriptional regulator
MYDAEFRFTEGWPFKPTPRGSRIGREELDGRQAALEQAPLLANLPKRHLRSIARVTGVRTYGEGAVMVKEGASGSSFFVILDGRARVVRGGRTLARLSPGDFFGEISLLDPGPRTASVVAETPTRCLDLAGGDFRRILAGQPQLALAMLRVMAQRLRAGQPSAPQ